jgi:hypothetical protein
MRYPYTTPCMHRTSVWDNVSAGDKRVRVASVVSRAYIVGALQGLTAPRPHRLHHWAIYVGALQGGGRRW